MAVKLAILRDWTTSRVQINTGPRGAGKTMLMVWMIWRALLVCEWINHIYVPLLGTKFFKKELHVWSNIPFRFRYQASQDGAKWPGAEVVQILSTVPLDMHKLYVFDEEMQWGFVFLDELDQYADRQDWQNGGQKLLMKILVQVRKLHLSLKATIQSMNWINPRLTFHIDTVTGCRDASRTRWGKSNDLAPGTEIFLYTRDYSGIDTGETYEESGNIYEAQLYGLPLQSLYDTDFILNPWEKYESISVARKKYVLDPHAKEEIEHYEVDTKIIPETIKELLQNGVGKLLRSEFFRLAYGNGMIMDKTEALNYMIDVHNVRKYVAMGQVCLDLTNVKNLGGVPSGKGKMKQEDAKV